MIIAPLLAWLGGTFTALAPFFWAMFTGLAAWLGVFFVGWLLLLLEAQTGWVMAFVTWVFGWFRDILGAVLLNVVQRLPEIDPGAAPVVDLSTVIGFLSWGNRYLPLAEAFGLLALWSSIYMGIVAYKAAKFVRGGG